MTALSSSTILQSWPATFAWTSLFNSWKPLFVSDSFIALHVWIPIALRASFKSKVLQERGKEIRNKMLSHNAFAFLKPLVSQSCVYLLLMHSFEQNKRNPFLFLNEVRNILNNCRQHVACYERNTRYNLQLIQFLG